MEDSRQLGRERQIRSTKAFCAEVDTGSAQQNAIKQEELDHLPIQYDWQMV